MAQTKLIGVDNSIQTADPSISQDYLDAVAYTETFANAVTRKSNPSFKLGLFLGNVTGMSEDWVECEEGRQVTLR